MLRPNKLLHMLRVARLCRELAIKQKLSKSEQNACFIMGILHDIGYEDCLESETSIHPQKSCVIINDFLRHSHDYLQAIKTHGRATDNITKFERILNQADLAVDSNGNITDINTRLTNIKSRYGAKSEHYQHAMEQANALHLKII